MDSSLDGDKMAALRLLLRAHRGRYNAITSRELSRRLGIPTREVREMVAGLVGSGELIGASVDGCEGGYYTIVEEEDLEQTRAILRARASAIFQRDRDLCSAWEAQHSGQLQPLLPGRWPD